MAPSLYRSLAALSTLLMVARAGAVTYPRYGGTLRLELRAAVRTLDPAAPAADPAEDLARERLAALVFERLVRFDQQGRPQPSLAVSWQHDARYLRWQFRLRPGVKFHDGSPLTAAVAAGELSRLNPEWQTSAAGERVVIRSARPLPDLLEELAGWRYSVVLREAGGVLNGTGPFRIAEWEPGRRAVFAVNQDHWMGRPFLDAVSVEMARPVRQQLLDLELGKADIVEITPGESLRASERGVKILSSAPLTLLVLVFEPGRPAAEDPRVREAIALSLDRDAIHTVLLQKQGEPAGGLLPRWLSGYAFLFRPARDVARARGLVAAIQPPPRPLALAHDPSDPEARLIAERISVNVREADLALQVTAQAGDLRLRRLTLEPVSPGRALSKLAAALSLPEAPSDGRTLEALYKTERSMIESLRVIPLVHLPELYCAGPNVKSWETRPILRSGEWRFDDVWLKPEKP